ncbi:threonine dehydrogenase-like Zn-dependent dehydrogenase [Amycolatopsis bartoniae]|uniref:Alcohol dehydrogenase n=1 Tax=Amycolatopsis bartoniae TaxID=941986 RepID=A0A8H9IXA8_9PSEU|nr:alcohol dehydrogenase catalytic domain-containing protein [Amycolatopsis bartoniae]MBB2935656.1 threonine dehydrogenase-like Zn-dependent dehydrogenase [Amycolatopsis bartoniae]TVT02330.1 alcohol dehydrogenase [Amycolatopsis bartoniae]GHF60895.1 alcohol dehydrogenase [Amycolatopsis bartoniae]
MKAFVVTAPGEAGVQEVEPPVARPGEVVVDIARVGVCGTDVEFFTGEMQYLHDGHARYPLRLGHEWAGTVSAAGDGVDQAWLGRRVTGDTMLGCGNCLRCGRGQHHVCEFREEIGIRGGRPGALAEQLAVPVTALHALPDDVDDTQGALVEPGGNALRAVRAAALAPGDRVLILGPGTIGLLAALFARAAGAEVHLAGLPGAENFPRALGFQHVWTADSVPPLPFDAVIDASNSPGLPAKAVELVEPGKRVVYIGLSGSPSLVDTRKLALKDVTAVGVLSGSPGLSGAIEQYASGAVDPRPLVAATVGLHEVSEVLAGVRIGPGPKIHVDPREGDQ